ncbi:flagella synthesis protein FlgN [Endothiovibrio diazotrophicus]
MNLEALPPALAPLLARELEESGRLLEALKEGERVFAGRDAEAIQHTANTILQLYQSVETLETQRQQLLGAAGLSPDREGMERIITAANDPRPRQAWDRLLDNAAQIQKQNAINARIVEGSRRHAEAAFNLLRGKEPASELYSAKGRTGYGSGSSGITSRTIGKA